MVGNAEAKNIRLLWMCAVKRGVLDFVSWEVYIDDCAEVFSLVFRSEKGMYIAKSDNVETKLHSDYIEWEPENWTACVAVRAGSQFSSI